MEQFTKEYNFELFWSVLSIIFYSPFDFYHSKKEAYHCLQNHSCSGYTYLFQVSVRPGNFHST